MSKFEDAVRRSCRNGQARCRMMLNIRFLKTANRILKS